MAELSAAHRALGAAMRERRRELGLSQKQLAEAANCTSNYVSLVENGEGNVSLSKLLWLAYALGVPASRLVAVAEAQFQP
jgi:transcriptional regulator with XRE-family HTH domain